MRERFRNPLPTVLALTFVTLLAIPTAAAASSGLPATVSMNPPSAGPGASVEITGLDFPGLEVVELHLATNAGSTHLFDTVTADSGYFREVVTLPSGLPAGAWELSASALDGAGASFRFDTGHALGANLAAADTEAAGSTGKSGTDVVFMLIIAVLLAAVGGSVAYALREVRRADRQPGMASGDDPIWGGGSSKEPPMELTAVDDPAWMAAHGKS